MVSKDRISTRSGANAQVSYFIAGSQRMGVPSSEMTDELLSVRTPVSQATCATVGSISYSSISACVHTPLGYLSPPAR